MTLSPEKVLKQYWGFDSFKNAQKNIITSILEGEDVLALLPTGGGKSICFQLPALMKPGICVVISPLVALMQDQVTKLKEKGIKAIHLSGGLSISELDTLLDNCIYGNYKFLYLSPERLLQPLVMSRIQQMPVNLIAIDEAHCISEWGHDFRPSYRLCSILKELHPKIPTIALTATATKKVIEDILTNLTIQHAKHFKNSFERNNIAFKVDYREDRLYGIKSVLDQSKTSAIVYVKTRRDASRLAQFLNENKTSCTFFHGGLPSHEKRKRLRIWLNNEVKVIVATNAFGMGIDKPDVDTVIHFQLPSSLENYFQEAGRAGRNGEAATAVLLANENEIERSKTYFFESLPDISFLKKLYHHLNTYLQIAYHEGTEEEYALNLNTFCKRYGLHQGKTYSALKLLEQNSVLSLKETSKEVNSIHLTAKKEELFRWIRKNKAMGEVLQGLLRTYGGVFDFETKINVSLLATKTNNKEVVVYETLTQLEKDGLAVFKKVNHDISLSFLKPREDERTINTITPHIENIIETKREKFQHMLNYINNTEICRSVQLLAYFDEHETEVCGNCDICLTTKNGQNISSIELKKSILHSISSGPKSSRDLVKLINYNEHHILSMLKLLLEDQEIRLNSNNTYDLN